MAITESLFPVLTSRLTLGPVTPADATGIYHLYADWEVARWLSRLPWPFTSASAHAFITEAAHDLERGSGCVLAMLERDTSAFVGVLSLRIPALETDPWTTDREMGILGYAVRREQRGNGFATEGAASATRLALEEIGLARLRATVLRDNVASRRVLERLGFVVKHADVLETPRHGGPARLGDTFMLERAESRSGSAE